MATLVKNHDTYALQFYEKNRSPQRKRVSLGTKDKRSALARQRKLEYDYLHGSYDPWTMDPFHYGKQDRLQEVVSIQEALDRFIARKRRDIEGLDHEAEATGRPRRCSPSRWTASTPTARATSKAPSRWRSSSARAGMPARRPKRRSA